MTEKKAGPGRRSRVGRARRASSPPRWTPTLSFRFPSPSSPQATWSSAPDSARQHEQGRASDSLVALEHCDAQRPSRLASLVGTGVGAGAAAARFVGGHWGWLTGRFRDRKRRGDGSGSSSWPSRWWVKGRQAELRSIDFSRGRQGNPSVRDDRTAGRASRGTSQSHL